MQVKQVAFLTPIKVGEKSAKNIPDVALECEKVSGKRSKSTLVKGNYRLSKLFLQTHFSL